MVARTDEPHAPWHLIAADSKRYARVAVIETVIAQIEEGMRAWGIEPPPPLNGGEDDEPRARPRRPGQIGSAPWQSNPGCARSNAAPRPVDAAARRARR